MTDEPKPPTDKTEDQEQPSAGIKVPALLADSLRQAGIDPNDPKVSLALEMTIMSFSGSSPLPPAMLLEQWEPLYPGITAKFIEWTETQASHRRTIELGRFDRSENRQDRGQILAFCIGIFGLAMAPLCVWLGGPIAGSIVGAVCAIVGVGGIAAATIAADKLKIALPDTKAAPKRRRAANSLSTGVKQDAPSQD